MVNKILYSQNFPKAIPLHAACGLLGKEGIFIVGGRREGPAWITDHMFFNFKTLEMQQKPKMTKALFGPAMTKPVRTAKNEVFYYIAGAAQDKTEIYQYLQSGESIGTWT